VLLDGTAGTDVDIQHGSMMDEGTGLRSDEESDDDSEISAGPQLEPRRPHSAETPIQDTAAADTTDEDSAQADGDPTLGGVRRLAESQLERRPWV
jgi:hypothetical protein